MKTIYSLLREIYGPHVRVDRNFVRNYLNIHGLKDQYEILDTNEFDTDVFFILTEWIPTLDELEEYKPMHK